MTEGEFSIVRISLVCMKYVRESESGYVMAGHCVARQTTLHQRFWAREVTAMKSIRGHWVVYCK